METTKRRVILVLVAGAILCGPALAACNTVDGFGRDLERLGDAISGKAREKSQ